ncbi:hypothetical protein H7F33_09890 [Pedobacter sp. PAMC26386]|nr:hypothetical protein H7F33_09890 [Pedobacter sp. PAMC26386]
MKNLKILVMLLLMQSSRVCSQQTRKKLEGWEIKYGLLIQNIPLDDSDGGKLLEGFIKDMMLAEREKGYFTCYVTDQQMRTEEKSSADRVTLSRKGDAFYYILNHGKKEASRKFRDASYVEEEMEDNIAIVISAGDYKVSFSDEEKCILGFSCRKAIFINPKIPGVEIVVWYTDKIPSHYRGREAYLRQLPGSALEIYSQENGMRIGMMAIRVKKIKIDEDIFSIPSDYRIINEQ